jgi:hypothetical protein
LASAFDACADGTIRPRQVFSIEKEPDFNQIVQRVAAIRHRRLADGDVL